MNDDDGLLTEEQRAYRDALAQRERLVGLGMRALAVDAMKWAVLLCTAALFFVAAWFGDFLRYGLATTLALIVYTPLVWTRGRK